MRAYFAIVDSVSLRDHSSESIRHVNSLAAKKRVSVCSLFLGVGEADLGHEDTVQELSLVLGADLADLVDAGASEGHGVVVDTVEDDLVLDLGGESGLGAGKHVDLLHVTLTQEVLHLQAVAVLGNSHVDGEMRMYQTHLVLEAL